MYSFEQLQLFLQYYKPYIVLNFNYVEDNNGERTFLINFESEDTPLSFEESCKSHGLMLPEELLRTYPCKGDIWQPNEKRKVTYRDSKGDVYYFRYEKDGNTFIGILSGGIINDTDFEDENEERLLEKVSDWLHKCRTITSYSWTTRVLC